MTPLVFKKKLFEAFFHHLKTGTYGEVGIIYSLNTTILATKLSLNCDNCEIIKLDKALLVGV